MKNYQDIKAIIKDFIVSKSYIFNRIVFAKKLKNEAYRKSIHLSALWIPAFIYFTNSSISFYLFSFLFFCDLILEYGNYKKWPLVRKTYGRMFYRAMRNKERRKDNFELVGSIYVLFAAMLCTMFFYTDVAVVAMTVMLVADAMAALFGKTYGRIMLRPGKSLEGTSAFFISAVLVMLALEFVHPVTYASIVACIFATVVEFFDDKLHIDDNLSIPIVVGLVLTFL